MSAMAWWLSICRLLPSSKLPISLMRSGRSYLVFTAGVADVLYNHCCVLPLALWNTVRGGGGMESLEIQRQLFFPSFIRFSGWWVMGCCSAQQHSCTATGFASTKHQLFRENWPQEDNRCTKENRERITLNIFLFCLLEIFKGRKSPSVMASDYFCPYKLILPYPFVHIIAL